MLELLDLLNNFMNARAQVLSFQNRENRGLGNPIQIRSSSCMARESDFHYDAPVVISSYGNDKIDPLLNILPGSIRRKLLNCLQSYFFSRHAYIIHDLRQLVQRFKHLRAIGLGPEQLISKASPEFSPRNSERTKSSLSLILDARTNPLPDAFSDFLDIDGYSKQAWFGLEDFLRVYLVSTPSIS